MRTFILTEIIGGDMAARYYQKRPGEHATRTSKARFDWMLKTARRNGSFAATNTRARQVNGPNGMTFRRTNAYRVAIPYGDWVGNGGYRDA